jgi:hypothetical protein
MLYSEIIAVCSQIHTKHINTLCGDLKSVVYGNRVRIVGSWTSLPTPFISAQRLSESTVQNT